MNQWVHSSVSDDPSYSATIVAKNLHLKPNSWISMWLFWWKYMKDVLFDWISYINFLSIDQTNLKISHKPKFSKEKATRPSCLGTWRNIKKTLAAFGCVYVIHLATDVFDFFLTSRMTLSYDIGRYCQTLRPKEKWPSNFLSRPLLFLDKCVNIYLV